MEVELLLLVFLLAGSCGRKTLYLVDLYICVDEFEEYCHEIPQWAVRAAIGLANHCNDILPGYTLSSSRKYFRPGNRSLLEDGEVTKRDALRQCSSCRIISIHNNDIRSHAVYM